MNELVEKFLNNKSKYSNNMDPLMSKMLNKNHDKKDFSSILAILGQKYVNDSNYLYGQYLSAKLIQLSSIDKIIMSKEHLEIIDYFENISQLQLKKFKQKSLIISLLLSFIMFLIFYFIGKIQLELATLISILLFLIDNHFFKANKEKLFKNILNKKLKSTNFNEINNFININIRKPL